MLEYLVSNSHLGTTIATTGSIEVLQIWPLDYFPNVLPFILKWISKAFCQCALVDLLWFMLLVVCASYQYMIDRNNFWSWSVGKKVHLQNTRASSMEKVDTIIITRFSVILILINFTVILSFLLHVGRALILYNTGHYWYMQTKPVIILQCFLCY